MKKILYLILAAVFVMVFSACNTNTVSQSAIENGESVKTEISKPEEVQPSSSQGASAKEGSLPSRVETVSSANQNVSKPQAKISRDKAISIALNKAGFSKNEVRELEAELDYERKVLVWEVDFEKEYKDYSYDIDALSGEILRTETEND